LIAEAEYGSGQTLREYIWLDDLPICDGRQCRHHADPPMRWPPSRFERDLN
jgi:hypothetical protein